MSGAGSHLYFRGALALPDDNEPSLIVDLRVDDEVVVITQDSEQIGSWPVELVDAERLNGQKFRLLLGDDEVIFHARDRLGFAYNGLSAIREAKERREQRRSRWWFERLVDGDADTPSPTAWVTKGLTSLKDAMSRTARSALEAGQARSKSITAARERRPSPPPSLLPPDEAPTASQEDGTFDRPDEAPLDDAFESDEPWGIPPEPATRPRPDRSRHRPEPAKRASRQSDDPWAMVADEVLRRDGEAAPRSAAPRERKRRTKRDHVHEYEETRLPGGLVRRVCACGEVVIRSID